MATQHQRNFKWSFCNWILSSQAVRVERLSAAHVNFTARTDYIISYSVFPSTSSQDERLRGCLRLIACHIEYPAVAPSGCSGHFLRSSGSGSWSPWLAAYQTRAATQPRAGRILCTLCVSWAVGGERCGVGTERSRGHSHAARNLTDDSEPADMDRKGLSYSPNPPFAQI